VNEIIKQFNWDGPIGFGFPGVVQRGVTSSAEHVAKHWLGFDAARFLTAACGRSISVINDADAAGLAEMRFGAGRQKMGVVLLVTIGTGLGTALFNDGRLCPNTELGHIEIGGKDAELYATDEIRKEFKLTWKQWGKNLNLYLKTLERYFSPDLFILGGGVSKQADKYIKYLTVQAEVIPAELRNDAGIIGAALAYELYKTTI